MKRLILLLIFINSIANTVSAQNSEPIFVIDNKLEVFADEFWRECNQVLDANSPFLDEMIERYADYRLQVYDATQRHLDTAAALSYEQNYFQNYLVYKHIIDGKRSQSIIKRLANDCGIQYRVSHIQVNINGNSTGDTAAAFFKAGKIRSRLTGGADFALVARQTSDDPSVNYNGGDLGYISVLEMPGLPFADYVKSHNNETSPSEPIRSGNAYHIIKVFDQRKAIDSVSVSIIEIKKTHRWRLDDSLRALANDLCHRIKEGADFDYLQKQYSYTRENITLPYYTAIDRYGAQISDLKYDGNAYQKPEEFYDSFIIAKVNKLIPRVPNTDMTRKAASVFATSSEFKEIVDLFLDSVKTVSGYTKLGEYGALKQAIDETIFDAQWIPQDGLTLIDDKLFTFAAKSYTLGDFAKYIYDNQQPCGYRSNTEYLNNKMQEMTNRLAFEHAKKLLLRRYPLYNTLLRESAYPLLCQLANTYNKTEQKALSRSAVEDYYQKNSLNYLSDYKLYLRILQPANGAVAKKYLKHANELALSPWKTPDLSLLKPMSADTFQLGQNPVADIIIRGFNSGTYSYPADKVVNLPEHNSIVIVKVLEEPHPIELDKIYNEISSEYRNTLKSEYIHNLRQKYNLKISSNAESIIKDSF